MGKGSPQDAPPSHKKRRTITNPKGVLASNRLYYEGLAHQRDKLSELEYANLYNEELEMRGATHKPDINKVSDMIATSTRDGRVQDRLIEYGEALRFKKEKLKIMKNHLL